MKKANETDTKKVLQAVSDGDSIPAGFAFAPHDANGPVLKLDDADEKSASDSGPVEKKG